MTTDRVLTIISIVIGLPAFLALFIANEHRLAAILTAIIVVLLILIRWWVKREEDRPQFTSLELRKVLKISSSDGRLATFERIERMKANFKGINEWWSRNMFQDGTVSDLTIDGTQPDLIQKGRGGLSVCKRFNRTLEKGEEVTITLRWTLHDAFLASHESMIHTNRVNAKEIFMTIELPRPCTRAEMRRTYGGDHGKLMTPPTLSMNNQKIDATIRKPRMGASLSYRLGLVTTKTVTSS